VGGLSLRRQAGPRCTQQSGCRRERRAEVVTTADLNQKRFIEILGRLGRMSVQDYYNPYRMFEWPDSLPT